MHNWFKHFPVPWWAKNSHVQTILPTFLKTHSLSLRRERLELEDGDFIDLDWADTSSPSDRVVVILHGLEGGSDSPYVKRLITLCQQKGIPAVVHHHRSCSGENNRLARSYHSGETNDFQRTFTYLKQLHPGREIHAVGYSLGGNALAKYLGEQQEKSLVDRAVIVSAPLQLSACAKRLEGGFSTIYQRHLIKKLQRKTAEKLASPQLRDSMPLQPSQLHQLKTFHDFDNLVTAPLHGFADVHDYYAKCSGLQFLNAVTTPTLIIHAEDDPFMTEAVIPKPAQLSESITYELYPFGGHVGFITGGPPWKPKYFLESRIGAFLSI
ncbi:hydrolase [Rubritalea spongiae]|uniref:Hydrolase n=1 Tax=Rubritalea spongiae TaxID=430797 RepID=A0ABW5E7D4_9BACT